jgi:hypothetical protein
MTAAPLIMAAPSLLNIQVMGTVYLMIVVLLLFDGAHLQGATAARFRVPGSVKVNPSSSSQLSNSHKAVYHAPVVVSTTIADEAVVERADFIAMFTDSDKQTAECGTAGSYNHFKSWRSEAATLPPPASTVEMTRKISEPEESSATVLHRKKIKFHAQRTDKGSPVPSGPGGNPGGN